MGRVTARRPVVRVGHGAVTSRPDTLAVEEPLEVRVGGRAFAVTMRTPGNDVELAHGFLVGEGVVRRADDVLAARYCAGTDDTGANTYNVLDVALAPHVPPPSASLERTTYTTSSCGVCGKASLEAVRVATPYDIAADPVRVDAAVLAGLPDELRRAQQAFDRTGGVHAAGLFTPDGRLLCAREDVGRHNAVDKVVGWALLQGRLPLQGHVLQVSGRASFELAQKAALAGIPVLSAVSAPSSLAVDLAEEVGMTLAGFVRGGTFNVYSGAQRIVAPDNAEPLPAR
ncbi:formate dehydrogenase accessory sulfurtransferase FdhD [Motilibacter deserti]|uniref:Sulfur carrier protein FdhD n=1 Tax=Motilibacter deserti TaxID=2714956 RepID=A0ABX0GPQ6_9ACTN|nr:formate dehydrogenase accessory sulfurtransferase FdhD [Motilibacter deserti]NHC12823.1 formate dehydrogenase accessory sulfurtransferase FdhD [Motilibacter deserti]